MRYLIVIVFALILSVNLTCVNAQVKTTGEEISYFGGIDSLTKEINFNLSKTLIDIPGNYILFFELITNKTSGIKNITILNKEQDSVSKKVYDAIEKTKTKWNNTSNRSQRVIIPVFLIKDGKGSDISKVNYHTITSNDYRKNKGLMKCFFALPIVINFYSQKY